MTPAPPAVDTIPGVSFRLRIRSAPNLVSSDAYAFERSVFEREYGVAPTAHDIEFAPFNDRSVIASVTDVDERVVGHLRLVVPGADPVAEPVKTVVEAGLPPWSLDVPRSIRATGMDLAHAWDVAALAVDRSLGRRRTTVLGALYHALVQLARSNDVRFLLMTVDERVRSTLRMVGLPTVALPGARPLPFCGSAASTPVWGDCADMLAHQRRTNPEAYRLITQGLGLTDVALPAPGSFRLPAAPAMVTVPRVPAPIANAPWWGEHATALTDTSRLSPAS